MSTKMQQVLARHVLEASQPIYRPYWVLFEDPDSDDTDTDTKSSTHGTVLGGTVYTYPSYPSYSTSTTYRVVFTDPRLPQLLYTAGYTYPFAPPTLLLDLKEESIGKGKVALPHHSSCIFKSGDALRLSFHYTHWTAAMDMSTVLLSVMVELQALVEREYTGEALPHEVEAQQVQVPPDFYAIEE